MARLAVTVRMHGRVVDEGIFEVRNRISLGEGRDAKIPFPGGKICAVVQNGSVWVRGIELSPGDTLSLGLLDVDVDLQHLAASPRAFRYSGIDFDRRFGMTALVILLSGIWFEAIGTVGAHDMQPQSVEPEGWGTGMTVSGNEARISLPDELDRSQAKGSQDAHVSDDLRTGIGYSVWAYSVLARPYEAWAQASPAERLVLTGQFSEALDLLDQPGQQAAPRTRAGALVRLGRLSEAHRVLLKYTEKSPYDSAAQLQLRELMDRMGQVESPQRVELSMPAAPAHHLLVSALMAARGGEEDLALSELGRLFANWDDLEPETRQKIRISLAVDPTFSAMRGHPGVISMLYRHLGSTAPARLR